MRFIKSFILKTFCLLLLFLVGCTGKGPTEAPGQSAAPLQNDAVSASPLPGGELRIPMTLSPATLHPLFLKETTMRNVFSMIFEPLVTFGERGEPVPCLAQSWEYVAEGSYWLVELRQGIHWQHDRGELTAQDVVFTLNTVLSNSSSCYYSGLTEYLSGAEAAGTAVRLFVKNPSFGLFYQLRIPIVPQSYYQGVPAVTSATPIGSGCFQVTGQQFDTASSRMELTVNTRWWKKQPVLERVTAIGYASNEEAIDAFLAGQLDCVPTSSITTDIYTLNEGVSSVSYMSGCYDCLCFNFRKDFSSDSAVRKAIAYSIHRSEIINNVYLNKATGAEQPVYTDSSLHTSAVEHYDYNPARAQELLQAAGYVDSNGDGFVEKDGRTFSLTLAVINVPSDPVRLETANALQEQLAQVGISVTVSSYSEAELKKAISANSYDLLLTGYYLPQLPSYTALLGSGNLSNYSSAEMSAAIAALFSSGTAEQLSSAMEALQARFSSDLPHIGLFFERSTMLYSSSLHPSSVTRDLWVYSTVNTWFYTA